MIVILASKSYHNSSVTLYLDQEWCFDPKLLVWNDVSSTRLLVEFHDEYSSHKIRNNADDAPTSKNTGFSY